MCFNNRRLVFLFLIIIAYKRRRNVRSKPNLSDDNNEIGWKNNDEYEDKNKE